MAQQSQPDYSCWTPTDLITRITTLETQLRAKNITHSTSSSPAPTPSKKKVKKPKPFDRSKYNTRMIALKFAYLGKRYNGFEHHSNNYTPLPTVEEELWKALMKTKLILPDFKGRREDEVCWEDCEYSKCGRTDKGVSAFGQVIGVRVRSSRPKEKQAEVAVEEDSSMPDAADTSEDGDSQQWNPIGDELPYIQMLNRVLPADIRILAWCPNPPPDFSARFSCKERRYRYFFTDPAYAPVPDEKPGGGAWLDVLAMQRAAKKLEGLHDFRNMCKVDPSKQISDFRRRIFHASVQMVEPQELVGGYLQRRPFAVFINGEGSYGMVNQLPELYYFEVRGSAFLWHQVRHMVAILFLVGQGYEEESIVDELLDIQKTPSRPIYDMAADTPLVLWDCIFPDSSELSQDDHELTSSSGYEDAMDWLYVGDTVQAVAGGATRSSTGIEDRKYGRMSIMEDLWSLWHTRKMDEVLAGSLMNMVACQGKGPNRASEITASKELPEISDMIFDGSGPRTVGNYVPLMQRERLDAPGVVNARYAVRKGILPKALLNGVAAAADE